jgi:predicted amidohydrolase YtcJ
LPVRVRLLVASGIADVERMVRTGDPWLELEGVKFYADGWLGSRTCALREPYSDDPDNDGILFLGADALARRADPFAEAGWTIATHAIGDRAVEAVLDGYERLYGSDCAAAAPRIEHAQVLAPDLVARMAGLGVVVCIQPTFGAADADTARVALGAERIEDAYRWAALLDAGVRVVAGSDFPVAQLALLVGLQCLLTGDQPDGRRAGAPTLSAAQALAVMTDPAAGTTVLSEDPHQVAEDEVAAIEVVESRPTG